MKRNTLNDNETQPKRHKPDKRDCYYGLGTSYHGICYQFKLLTLFFLKALNTLNTLNEIIKFELATEWRIAEKFDDMILRYIIENREIYHFLQAKHRADESKEITKNCLMNEENGDFSIQKYFTSYRNIRKQNEFIGAELKRFILCTNIDLEDSLKCNFKPIKDEHGIMDKEYKNKKAMCYKLKNGTLKKEIRLILKNTSDLYRLAKEMAKTDKLNLAGLFKEYHEVLLEKVLDVHEKKFIDKGKEKKEYYCEFLTTFLESDSENDKKFIKTFIECSKKKKTIESLKNWSIPISESFAIRFKIEVTPELKNISDFVKTFQNLINSSKENIVKVDRRTIINDNIDKLAGHILIKKDNEEENNLYYFSEAFLNKNSSSLPLDLENFRKALEIKSEIKLNELKFQIKNFKTCKDGEQNKNFTLPDDFIPDTEIEDFLNKLVFAVNQPNENELDDVIKDEIRNIKDLKINDVNDLYNSFIIYMQHWLRRDEPIFRNEKDGEKIVNDFICDYSKIILIGQNMINYAFIEELGIEFCPNALNNLKLKFNIFFNSDQKFFNLLTKTIKLSSAKVYKVLRSLPEYKKNDSFIFIHLSSLINYKDYVNKGLQNDNLLVIVCEKINNYKPNELDVLYEVLRKILVEFTLKKIILITEQNETSTLAEILKKNLQLLFIECNDQINNFSDLTDKAQAVFLNERTIIFQGKPVHLKEIFNECPRTKNFPLIVNYPYNIIDADVLEMLVNKDEINIGNPVDEIKIFYFNQQLDRDIDIEHKFVIIVGAPGMGKSLFVKNLALKAKEKDPKIWIIRINFFKYLENIKTFELNIENEEYIKKVMYFFCRKEGSSGNLDLFENKLMNHFYDVRKIIVVFDKLKNITSISNDKMKFLKLLQMLRKSKVKQIWITLRPYCIQAELEKELSTKSYNLLPIAHENQRKFLKDYWKWSFNLDELGPHTNLFINELFEKFSEATNDQQHGFGSIPFQLQLLGEEFQDAFQICHNSTNFEEGKKKILDRLNLVNLFDDFFHKKNKQYSDEISNDQSQSRLIERNLNVRVYNNYESLAIFCLFGEAGLNMLKEDFKDLLSTESDNIGLIGRVIDNKPIFVHYSLTEYFASSWFANNWKKMQNVKTFLREHMFCETRKVTRLFFDYFMTKNINDQNMYQIHEATINNNISKLQQYLVSNPGAINDLDKAGRTILHISCGYGFETIVLFLLKDVRLKSELNDKLFECSARIYAEKGEWHNIITLLSDNVSL